jgi:hypothetical protein
MAEGLANEKCCALSNICQDKWQGIVSLAGNSSLSTFTIHVRNSRSHINMLHTFLCLSL